MLTPIPLYNAHPLCFIILQSTHYFPRALCFQIFISRELYCHMRETRKSSSKAGIEGPNAFGCVHVVSSVKRRAIMPLWPINTLLEKQMTPAWLVGL